MTKAATRYVKIDLPKVPTFNKGYGFGPLSEADRAVSESLRGRCNSFDPAINLYTKKGDNSGTQYVLKEYRFNINGGRPDVVLARYKEVVALLEEQEVRDLFVNAGWGGGITTLRATSYVPATDEEIAKWEAEKVRATKLIDGVKKAKQKYLDDKATRAKRRADADARMAKARAEAQAREKREEAERAKAKTIGGAMEILRAAGYTVISSPTPPKTNPAPRKTTTKKKG